MTVLERHAPSVAEALQAQPQAVPQEQAQSPAQAQSQVSATAPASAPKATATVKPTIAATVALDDRIASSRVIEVQARVLKVQAALLQATGFVAGQQALVAAVARHYQFDRVSLGWVRNKAVVVQAISQNVVARLDTEAMAPCAAAMHEALDQ